MLTALLPTLGLLLSTQPHLSNLHEVPFTQVEIKDCFWSPRQETNRTISLAHNLDKLEQAGNIANLELAAAHQHAGYHGPVFMDSDLFKGVEAVAYSLATHPDPTLSARLDAVISKIAAAQMPDGYLNTHYQVNAPDKRFSNLRDNHELYCAGHLFEAAVAHYQATSSKALLDVATKYADLLVTTFGPDKRPGYCGHPEIELALVKLSRVVDSPRKESYFALAKHFIDTRGSHFFAQEHNTPEAKYNGEYWQDNVPIRDHQRIVGHAVRAAYLLSACTDIGAATADESLLRMVRRVWRNTTERNTYLTGGIGPSAHNEGFTVDYDLPNESAYQETCASVAMILWNHRLNLAYADAKYADAVETALYNGALAGVSLDGTKFFYVNPLASRGGHHRADWYGCACCPPNICRLLASLGNYIYATGGDGKGLWVNQFVAGSVTPAALKGFKLSVTTTYPWSGVVEFKVDSVAAADPRTTLHLRVPSWCPTATYLINDTLNSNPTIKDGYITISQTWKPGDTIRFILNMPVRRVEANPNVEADRGLQAIARGPLIYCIEGIDAANQSPLAIAPDTQLQVVDRPDLLGGIMTITGKAMIRTEQPPSRSLYAAASPAKEIPFRAIPYYAWDNRTPGPMQVWHPTTPPAPKVQTVEGRAKVSISYKNWNCDPEAAHDGITPAKSNETPPANCHWWSHKGGTEWIAYEWAQPIDVAAIQVFWFDDTGRGECRLPKSARLFAKSGDAWKAVGVVPVAKDAWCDLKFDALQTSALKLEIEQQDGWSSGILEWRTLAPEPAD